MSTKFLFKKTIIVYINIKESCQERRAQCAQCYERNEHFLIQLTHHDEHDEQTSAFYVQRYKHNEQYLSCACCA